MKSNVLHLSKFYKPFKGGVEEVVATISEGTLERRPTVLSFSHTKASGEECVNGVNVFRFKYFFKIGSAPISFSYVLAVIKYMRNHNIIHLHLPNPIAVLGVYLGYYLCFNKRMIVVHWHSDVVKQKILLQLFLPLQTWILRKAHKIIVTSPNYLEGSSQLSLFRRKCEVIPIGIHSMADKVKPSLVKDIQCKYHGKTIIFALGRHTYYKDFTTLIEASKDLENVVVLIGGVGQETKNYISLIKQLGLQNKVHLIGRIPDDHLPSYFAGSDMFCLPSCERSEAYGVVQLEAMSVGTCVVSADIQGSGVPWVNENEQSGLVFEPKNSGDLSSKLKLLASDAMLLRRYGINAKKRYQRLFTATKMNSEVDKLYSSFDHSRDH